MKLFRRAFNDPVMFAAIIVTWHSQMRKTRCPQDLIFLDVMLKTDMIVVQQMSDVQRRLVWADSLDVLVNVLFWVSNLGSIMFAGMQVSRYIPPDPERGAYMMLAGVAGCVIHIIWRKWGACRLLGIER